MPNWCQNHMVVKGSSEELDRFMDTVITEVEPDGDSKLNFDFNKIMPMPPELMITSGGSVNEAISIIQYENDGDTRDLEKYKEYVWVKEALGNNPSYDDIVSFLKSRMTDTDKSMQEGYQALENIRKYGHQDWYSWCTSLDHWGTKWGACDTYIQEDTDQIFIEYQTAWSPGSQAFFQKLSEMFPTLEIDNWFIEEGCAFAGGYHLKDGELEEDSADMDWIREEIFGYSNEEDWDDEDLDPVHKCGDCGCVVDNEGEICSACALKKREKAEKKRSKAKLAREKKKGFDREKLAKTKIIPKDL